MYCEFKEKDGKYICDNCGKEAPSDKYSSVCGFTTVAVLEALQIEDKPKACCREKKSTKL